MALHKARLFVRTARRIPDPNFPGIERHEFVVPVKSVPSELPLDPNARVPKTSKRVYKKVEDSLFNVDCEPGTFHLKNKGITIVAKAVNKLDNDNFEITMESGIHGIVDGGHTHKIITEAQANPDLPEAQFVNVQVRVGVPSDWISDIAGGLNTSVQVQDMSLDNLAGQFQWLKNVLKPEPYFQYIAWSENDVGEFDARDIISIMTLFNIDLFPNSGDDHPVMAYEKKSQALKAFENHPACYENMKGVVRDILRFHDIVRRDYRQIWNDAQGNAGKLAISEGHGGAEFPLRFIQETVEFRMYPGALYPILAAFRWFMVKDSKTGEFRWRDGFDGLLATWRECALPLLKATFDMSTSLKQNPQLIGKSRPHWGNLHNMIAKKDQERTIANLKADAANAA